MPMATLYRSAVRAAVFDTSTQCVCRHVSHPSKIRLPEQVRCLSRTPALPSGHSKWASIKHDKAKNDAKKSKLRSLMTRDITNAVKLGGSPNANLNPRLVVALNTARDAGVPKASRQAAIARGQGISVSGAPLESLVLEAMLPPSVATIIECQTDNKLRTLAQLRLLVKEAGGTVSPVGYMFEKKGRIILQKKDGVGVDGVLEPALEAGALDVLEGEEGRIVLFTEPAQTTTIAEALAKKLDMGIEEREIIYDPNEDTKVSLENEAAAKFLNSFLDALQEVQGVTGVYTNWSKGTIDEGLWDELRSKVAV